MAHTRQEQFKQRKIGCTYGWIIVFAFFMVEMLVDGVRFSFGIYFIEFLSVFHKGKGETVWIGSITVAVYNLGGPVYAVIVDKIGSRNSSVIGAVITVIGFLLSHCSTKLFHLYFTYGFLQGFGFGLMYVAGVVIIGRYFLKNRALAMGIGLCGSGAGMFFITPLVEYVMDLYSWRGSMFILAALSIQTCVFSTLYHSPPCNNFNFEDTLVAADDDEKGNIPLMDPSEHAILNRVNGDNNIAHGKFETETNTVLLLGEIASDLNGVILDKDETYKHCAASHTMTFCQDVNQTDQGTLTNLNVPLGRQTNESLEYVTEKIKLSKSNLMSVYHKECAVKEESFDKFKIVVIEMLFPKKLVVNSNFILMMISSFFAGLASYIPFSMLPDYATSLGYTKSDGGWLLSVIGISGIFSRIVGGWLSDIPCCNRVILLSLCFLLCGMSTVLLPVITSYHFLIVYASLFGILYGASYIVQPIMMLEYFGAEYIAPIMGITMAMFGVSIALGGPIAGWLSDGTGNSSTSFLFSGSSFMLSGIIHFLVLCTKTQPINPSRVHTEVTIN